MKRTKSIQILIIAAILILSTLIVDTPVAPVKSASSSTLSLGVVATPPTTFFQNELQDYFVGTPDTGIPYLPYGTVGLGGVFQPRIGKLPVSVPGTNDSSWTMSVASPNMKWSDGVPINATDLAYSFGLFLSTGPYANLSSADPYGQIQGNVQSVSIVNATSIRVDLAGPTPLWPVLSYLYAIYPYHYFKQYQGDDAVGKASIVGGPGDSPYVPQGYVAGSTSMTLVPNPYSPFWNGKTPTIQTVTVNIFASESALVNSLASRGTDAAVIQQSDVAAMASTSSVAISELPSLNQMFVYLKTNGYPWGNNAFRQAMFYLINGSQIDQQLYQGKIPLGNALGMVSQAAAQYWPGPSTPLYNFSLTKAASLLTAAGLTKNSAGNWQYSNGTLVTIGLETTNSDPNFVRATQFIQGWLQQVGLKVDLKVVAFSQAETDFGAVNFQFLVYPNFYSSIPYRYLKNPANYPNFVNSTFRAKILTAIHDINATRSLQELKDAELYFAQSAVFCTIVVLPQYVAYNTASFTNWQPAISQVPNHDAFHNAAFDELVLTAVTPVGSTTTTTTTSTSNTGPTSTSTTSATGSTSTSTSTTMTTSAPDYTYYYVGGAIAVLLVVVGIVYAMRRPKAPAT